MIKIEERERERDGAIKGERMILGKKGGSKDDSERQKN